MSAPITAIDPAPAAGARAALRLCTAGSVDDGKSTFVGRLLHDTRSILADQYDAVAAGSAARGRPGVDLALLVDGLRAEREQGITIDVAHRYFATPARSFILADCPGHEQYTRNTVTGMSTAEAVVLLVDARHGVVTQTRRHATVAALLGVRHLIVAVNKIDLLDFAEAPFRAIEAEVRELGARLGLPGIDVVPVSALAGDNVVARSARTPWYAGPAVLELLEGLDLAADAAAAAAADLRLPVETVLRHPGADYRGYAGRIAAGRVRPGDRVDLPGGRRARVTGLTRSGDPVASAAAGDSVALTLDAQVDLARGDLIAVAPPEPTRVLAATVVHLADRPLPLGRTVLLRHGAAEVRARVAEVRRLIDVDTGAGAAGADRLAANDLAEVRIELAAALPVEPHRGGAVAGFSRIGVFLLVDPGDGDTLAAGLVR
ncbi:sulfate adenylyltransferase subunit 1 [Corynebacterium sphenisci]|uniref:sulfate adenylyltransferase subunit 1 n=1 Tax=Corynebacterium sphenisci TaxID=191493 RepID=UPI0026E09226|nr:GTP-binding protein [Corynebacterium sphenisci]MDO5730571.1 GTP-binding protein [Corynebacterium sphenisci]